MLLLGETLLIASSLLNSSILLESHIHSFLFFLFYLFFFFSMIQIFNFRIALIGLVLIHTVDAWGALGHSLMGNVVMHFLSHHAKEKLKQLFRAEQGKLDAISSWADQIKHLPKYERTNELHYSNAHDNPPFECSFHYQRDCKHGMCVVAAIQAFSTAVHNYTVRNSELLPKMYPPPFINPVLLIDPHFHFTLAETIKFLVHFVQDIHQPLHVTGRDRGGNDTPVKFDGENTQLHFVWDVLLLEKFYKEECQQKEDLFVKHILQLLAKEQFSIHSWLQCPTKSTANTLKLEFEPLLSEKVKIRHHHRLKEDLDAILCPATWAHHIDQINCQFVWQFDATQDLSKEYYQKTINVTLRSIAMGSIRLAALLDMIL
ncbi:hypothetical protein HMI54_003392 [Coelomomyces lativittatus]|nr:hypothetical protein HMI54_003392 [Coelomomyces lativittatus]KAJ1516005.1 hypothetical protein HMI55_003167 [Coelomomyces lativittatus]